MENCEQIASGIYKKPAPHNVNSMQNTVGELTEMVANLREDPKAKKFLEDKGPMVPKLRKSMLMRVYENSQKKVISSTPHYKTRYYFFGNNSSIALSPISLDNVTTGSSNRKKQDTNFSPRETKNTSESKRKMTNNVSIRYEGEENKSEAHTSVSPSSASRKRKVRKDIGVTKIIKAKKKVGRPRKESSSRNKAQSEKDILMKSLSLTPSVIYVESDNSQQGPTSVKTRLRNVSPVKTDTAKKLQDTNNANSISLKPQDCSGLAKAISPKLTTPDGNIVGSKLLSHNKSAFSQPLEMQDDTNPPANKEVLQVRITKLPRNVVEMLSKTAGGNEYIDENPESQGPAKIARTDTISLKRVCNSPEKEPDVLPESSKSSCDQRSIKMTSSQAAHTRRRSSRPQSSNHTQRLVNIFESLTGSSSDNKILNFTDGEPSISFEVEGKTKPWRFDKSLEERENSDIWRKYVNENDDLYNSDDGSGDNVSLMAPKKSCRLQNHLTIATKVYPVKSSTKQGNRPTRKRANTFSSESSTDSSDTENIVKDISSLDRELLGVRPLNKSVPSVTHKTSAGKTNVEPKNTLMNSVSTDKTAGKINTESATIPKPSGLSSNAKRNPKILSPTETTSCPDTTNGNVSELIIQATQSGKKLNKKRNTCVSRSNRTPLIETLQDMRSEANTREQISGGENASMSATNEKDKSNNPIIDATTSESSANISSLSTRHSPRNGVSIAVESVTKRNLPKSRAEEESTKMLNNKNGKKKSIATQSNVINSLCPSHLSLCDEIPSTQPSDKINALSIGHMSQINRPTTIMEETSETVEFATKTKRQILGTERKSTKVEQKRDKEDITVEETTSNDNGSVSQAAEYETSGKNLRSRTKRNLYKSSDKTLKPSTSAIEERVNGSVVNNSLVPTRHKRQNSRLKVAESAKKTRKQSNAANVSKKELKANKRQSIIVDSIPTERPVITSPLSVRITDQNKTSVGVESATRTKTSTDISNKEDEQETLAVGSAVIGNAAKINPLPNATTSSTSQVAKPRTKSKKQKSKGLNTSTKTLNNENQQNSQVVEATTSERYTRPQRNRRPVRGLTDIIIPEEYIITNRKINIRSFSRQKRTKRTKSSINMTKKIHKELSQSKGKDVITGPLSLNITDQNKTLVGVESATSTKTSTNISNKENEQETLGVESAVIGNAAQKVSETCDNIGLAEDTDTIQTEGPVEIPSDICNQVPLAQENFEDSFEQVITCIEDKYKNKEYVDIDFARDNWVDQIKDWERKMLPSGEDSSGEDEDAWEYIDSSLSNQMIQTSNQSLVKSVNKSSQNHRASRSNKRSTKQLNLKKKPRLATVIKKIKSRAQSLKSNLPEDLPRQLDNVVNSSFVTYKVNGNEKKTQFAVKRPPMLYNSFIPKCMIYPGIQEDDFMCGYLEIAAGQKKNKCICTAKRFSFTVIVGSAIVRCNNSINTFEVGDQFLINKGLTYSITNVNKNQTLLLNFSRIIENV